MTRSPEFEEQAAVLVAQFPRLTQVFAAVESGADKDPNQFKVIQAEGRAVLRVALTPTVTDAPACRVYMVHDIPTGECTLRTVERADE